MNALLCPGLGSFTVRRKGVGIFQMGLALAGAGWMLVALGRYFLAFARLLQTPPDWRMYLDSGLAGLVIFGAGWIWSIVTSLLLLRQAK